MTKAKSILVYTTIIIVGTFFLVKALLEARSFLIPLVTAMILALLVLPLSQKMEKGFLNRGAASFINTFLLFLLSVGFIALLSVQVKNVVDDWPQIKQAMQPNVQQLKAFVFEHTPIKPKDLEETQKASEGIPFVSSGPQAGQQAREFFNSVLGFFGDYLLTFIYIFFLLNYRRRFKEFLLRLFPDRKKEEVQEVIRKSAEVTQQYLIGKLLLILLLAALYAVGLGISGIDNFILVSALAAVFSLIPYIGNVIGFGIAMAFGYLTSGDTAVLIGIIITFSIAQFVESYILEPYVVGDKVDLHPFFVILSVIVGNLIWGIMGMILAIPLLAIIHVILLNLPSLHAFGFLLSNEDLD